MKRRAPVGRVFDWARAHPVAAALAVAILARVAAFVLSIFLPIHNEAGGRVSPLDVQSGTDLEFYALTVRKYFLGDGSVLNDLIGFYDDPSPSASFAPPAFPLLLYISGYYGGHALPLSLLYLGLGIAFAAIWIVWMRRNGLGLAALVLFALLPNSIWFTISVTTDLLFAVAFGGFYVCYFRGPQDASRTGLALACLFVAVMTRTNSVSILLFVCLDLALRLARGERRHLPSFLAALGVTVVVSAFYLPSLSGYMATGDRVRFFTLSTEQYMVGLFEDLPAIVDGAFSWLALFGAKLLYLVGLRPSFSDVPLGIVLLRGAAGVVLLPGIYHLMRHAPSRERVLIALFLLPFLLGPAQDRYVLPIQGILFLHGVRFYGALWAKLPRRGRGSWRSDARRRHDEARSSV